MNFITPADNPAPQKIIDIEVVILGWQLFALWWQHGDGWSSIGVILFGFGVSRP